MAEAPPAAGRLRADRDRFVAFAFASSDLLLELDPTLTIYFAAGACDVLLGRPKESLLGVPFVDIFAPGDRAEVRRALGAIGAGRRAEPMVARLLGSFGAAPQIVLTGTCVPDLDNHFYMSLSMVPGAAKALATVKHPAERDRATGLHESAAFGEVAKARLEQGKELGENYALTLLDLSDFERLRPQIDEAVAGSLFATIGETLRANSVGGDSAGRIDADKYGVIHHRSASVDTLQRTLTDLVRGATPEARDFALDAASVELDATAMSEEEAARAIVYTLNKFRSVKAHEFSIATLSAGCRAMLDETVARVAEVKNTIAAGLFDLVFQPIVDLKERQPHHYEALARNIGGQANRSPFEFVTLAEEIGLIADFDLAVCRRAIATLEQDAGGRKIAVNLSGFSLGRPGFDDALMALLRAHPLARHRLLFEVTESAEIADLVAVNRVLQELRRTGHAVCLDDFGSGAAAFEYLRSLEVDFVKIDGSYVKGAVATTYGHSFLKCITALCRDLKIGTIGEMVEDEATWRLLKTVGVDFGQGFYFGKPLPRIPLLEPGDPAATIPPPMYLRRFAKSPASG